MAIMRKACFMNSAHPYLWTCGRVSVQSSALYPAGQEDVFAAMDRQFQDMERQMDRDFAEIFGESRLQGMLQQQNIQMQQLQERMEQKQQQQQPGARVDILERQSSGNTAGSPYSRSFSYYQSVEVYNEASHGVYNRYASTSLKSPAPASYLLLPVFLLAAAYAAVCTLFYKRFYLTTYSSQKMWSLIPFWPILSISNEAFRKQLASVLKGERVRVSKEAFDTDSSA
ncbi:hypothetical protein CEUSTIGMA_g5264.t1 [Chlamydomonas eustigma]|uniref:Uncharacterized protein n=1 Tax=Chlamydomonas eustigma TaxID=1157962 RepID=A0A250X428_9CHLO|nr:hypothetical protein CEUSTIGMA_g5264.t1 [Chlamydomonas eustigma]|eukprot:GAX77821.1 hypothetical protein CEUSTIGMA_g5264.t1 [Chlamydomonas eustigma]